MYVRIYYNEKEGVFCAVRNKTSNVKQVNLNL